MVKIDEFEVKSIMNVYFIRHGQSEANILNEFSNTGIKHPLTTLGIEQSKKLGESLKSIEFESIFSSPLLRAIETALIISEIIGKKQIILDSALKEFSVGILEGKSDPISWNQFKKIRDLWEKEENWDISLPQGESLNEIRTRFLGFFNKLYKKYSGKDVNILILSHGGLFSSVLPSIFSNVNYSYARNHSLDNTSFIIGIDTPEGFLCKKWGDYFL